MNKKILAALVLGITATAYAENVTVSPYDMHGWAFFDDDAGGPCLPTSVCAIDIAPVPGNGRAGAVHFKTQVNLDRPRIGTKSTELAGKPFSALTSMSYDTLVVANPASPAQATALQFDFDDDVGDADYSFKGRIVFEPYWQGANPVKGIWQTWNTEGGRWWLTRAGSPSLVAAGLPAGTCGQSNPCTLAELLQRLPHAGIADGVGRPNVLLAAGSYWPGFDGYADNFSARFGSEQISVQFDRGPHSKETCKDGGWVGFTRNQGQCVSTFASDR